MNVSPGKKPGASAPGPERLSMSTPTSTVAALYVESGGVYDGIEGVESWGLPDRDARTYAGPWPVVAHPPCARWCQLAAVVEARWGHKRGDDGGCFAAALAAVRAWGGVLEHPAYSAAWDTFDLPVPPSHGGWVRGLCGGWSCYVEQRRYGHRAKKATWLYAVGCELPTLRWGFGAQGEVLVSRCTNRSFRGADRPRIQSANASRTPIEFRDVLITMARSVVLARREAV